MSVVTGQANDFKVKAGSFRFKKETFYNEYDGMLE